MDTAKKAVDVTAKAGMGQTPLGDYAHPIHPATVHWPIGLLSTAFAIDTVQAFAPGLLPATASTSGSVLSKILPPVTALSPLSHYINAAGIAFTTISVATGVSELYGMWKGQAAQKGGWGAALKEAYLGKDENDVGAHKLKTAIEHASMNDVVAGIAIFNFYKRATSPTLALPRFNALLSALIAIPLLLYSAKLGGSLVYEMGVGVQRQGEGLDFKAKQGIKKE